MRKETTTQLIVELIKMTKNDEINWVSFSPPTTELPEGGFIIDKVYRIKIKNKTFRLFKYKYKIWRDEENYEWQTSISLELMDEYGKTDYEFEYVSSMNDLYDIVREQCSDVSNVIDDLLGLNLEILEASYSTPKISIDILQKLKQKINKNKLNLLVSNDIAGEDPEPMVVKKLKVKYKYGDKINEKEIVEGQRLILP